MGKITKAGGVLQFDGSPLNEIGVNSYQLFYQSISSGNFATTTARLSALQGYGVRIVRTLLCPFWPNELDVYRDTPATYFSRMATFLDLCEAHGISIVADLCWRYATFTDPADVNTLGTQASTGRALLRSYFGDVASRFYSHNAIAAWEIGNEYDLHKDSSVLLPSASVSDGTKASYSAPNDVLSSAAINAIYSDAVTAIRAYDSDRIIFAGTVGAYGNSSIATWKSSFATDSSGMDAYCLHLYPGKSGVSGTIFTGPFGDNSISAYYALRQIASQGEADSKPIIVGEFGCQTDWAYADRMDVFNSQIDAIISAGVPLALVWNYPDGPTEYSDVTDIMPLISGWNARMRQGPLQTISPTGRVIVNDRGYFEFNHNV